MEFKSDSCLSFLQAKLYIYPNERKLQTAASYASLAYNHHFAVWKAEKVRVNKKHKLCGK